MIDARRAITNIACLVGAAVFAPIRRRRLAELKSGPEIRSILVFNDVRGLGNLVFLSGLLLNLRRLYPGAKIAVAMPSSPLARSVIGPELADEFLFFDPRLPRRSLLGFAWRVLRPRRFSLGLATFFSPTLLRSCALAVAGCRYRVAYGQTGTCGFLNTLTLLDASGHELDRHLRLLGFAGQDLRREIAVRVTPEAEREAGRFLTGLGLENGRPLLGVHPGCDRANVLKRWPVERFAAVINRLVTDGLASVLVFLGPDDAELHEPLRQVLRHEVHIVSGRGLEFVIALIGRCDAFLSNDSGLMHVAAAQGVPVVAIFGPTDTVKNAPVGKATMLTASNVACRPCYAGAPIVCAQERRYCLEGVAIVDVVRSLRRMLSASLVRAASDVTGSALRADHAG